MEPEFDEPLSISEQIAIARINKNKKELIRLMKLRDIMQSTKKSNKNDEYDEYDENSENYDNDKYSKYSENYEYDEDIINKCDNKFDPFTMNPIRLQNIIVIFQDNKYWCFELIPLAKQLFYKTSNPYTRTPFTAEDIDRVFTAAENNPIIINQKYEMHGFPTDKLINVRYSMCEEEIITDLINYYKEIHYIIQNSKHYIADLYNLYQIINETPLHKLNKCSVARNPRMIIMFITRLLTYILEIFPQKIEK